ncbi:hypothetical protein ILUMI_11134 [Ignelater luminosus]|uniref:PiggyBac transposable element-derived protein domain-containing protein n=1 Tax=Ignelater luminosus TaxID=2038154 RepID=A0A8K0CWM2_IGNLU|nr:hypothetical protein ILUMI_11134 [Ignelater luminosus]
MKYKVQRKWKLPKKKECKNETFREEVGNPNKRTPAKKQKKLSGCRYHFGRQKTSRENESRVQAFLRAQTLLIVGEDENVGDNVIDIANNSQETDKISEYNEETNLNIMELQQRLKQDSFIDWDKNNSSLENAYGTVNSTRQDMPKFEQDNNMKRGDCDYYISNNGLLAIKWKNKKSVRFHSNYHRPDDVTFVKRKKKDGSTENIPCPRVLKDYSKNI